MKETKKVKEKSFSKRKGKGNHDKKKSLQEAAGHNRGPPKQTYYCGSGLEFQVKEIKKVKEHFRTG